MIEPAADPVPPVAVSGQLSAAERSGGPHAPECSESSASPVMNPSERLATCSPKQREHFNLRCDVVRPLLKDDPAYDPHATPVSQAKKHGFTRAAIYGWLKLVEDAGSDINALIPLPRGGKGGTRSLDEADEDDAEAVEFLVGIALLLMRLSGDTIPLSEICRRYRKEASQRGWKIPSRWVIRRLLQAKIPRSQRKYAAGGLDGFRKEIRPKLPASGPDGPNRVWVADCKRLHVWCFDSNGRPRRYTIVAILDRFDGCVMGWAFDREPNAFAFGRALCMAILTYGKPKAIVTDKGSEFLNIYVRNIFHVLRIELQEVTPGHPWVRGDMEAFFKTFDVMFCRFVEGHTGNKPTSKPTWKHARFTVLEIHKQFQAWVRDEYHREPFHSRRLNGQRISRDELRHSVPYIAEIPNERDLLLRLLPTATKTAINGGVSLHGVVYNHRDLQLLSAERPRVEIRFDPLDLAGVWVFFKSRFVCFAMNSQAYRARLTMADIRERQQKNRELEKATKMVVDPAIQKYRNINDRMTQLAMDREPAQLAAVGGGPAQRIPLMLPVEASARRAIAAESESTAGTRRAKNRGLRTPFDKPVELDEWERP